MIKSEQTPTVFVIDDDTSVCKSLSLLLKSGGYNVRCYCDCNEIFFGDEFNEEGCILLDVFLGKRSALELQNEVASRFSHLPIIFMSGKGSIPISVRAMKQGAVNFLQKPVEAGDLFKAIEEAIGLSKTLRSQQVEKDNVTSRINKLTPRESEVFHQLITGKLNKQIAGDLGIAEHTVKLHRGKITEKLGVKSVAEMVQMAELVKN